MKKRWSVLVLGVGVAAWVGGCEAASSGVLSGNVSSTGDIYTGIGDVSPTGDVYTGVGDLDNDKDLDLIVLHTVDGAMSFHMGGVKAKKHEKTGLRSPVHVALVDLTDPSGKKPDTYLDLVVLEQDKGAGKGRLHVWANLGKTGNVWNGVKKLDAYPLDHPFDLAWGGSFADSSGHGVVLFDARRNFFRGAKCKWDNTGSFTGFKFDADRKPDAGETIEFVSAHASSGLAFVMLDAKSKPVIRHYKFGEKLK